ncbi:hypothetical protein REPUB_Repub18cG0063200 [Reevesia pubescens]
MNSENEPTSPVSSSSIKQKLKSSLRLPCLRHHNHHQQRVSLSPSTTPPATPGPNPSPMANSHYKQRLSRTLSQMSPEIKDKCRNLINRIGNGHAPGHRRSHSHGRRHSADFRYDPSSYALNFDEGCDDSHLNEYPVRNFTSRLPPSPTSTTSGAITAFT